METDCQGYASEIRLGTIDLDRKRQDETFVYIEIH